MTINYWTSFSKRKNSTKRPTGGTQVNVNLKAGTSLEAPVFILTASDAFNIVYVEAFGHYYFVSDVRHLTNDTVEVSCSQDVLATYKTAIGGYTCMIERAASAYNTLIPDESCAMHNDMYILHNEVSMQGFFNATGTYVLTVLNNIGSGAGFTCYYLISAANLQALASYVNSDWLNDPSITDILDALKATFLKTADAIVSCIWIPLAFDSATPGTVSETIRIGVDDVSGVTGYRITSVNIKELRPTVTIQHMYSDFRKGNPFTTVRMYIPFFGSVDINPLDFYDNKIQVCYAVDITTGDVLVRLRDSNNYIVSTLTFNIAVNCPVARVGANVQGAIAGALSTATGIAQAIAAPSKAGTVTASLGAAAAGVNALATAAAPSLSYKGTTGGKVMAIYENIDCVSFIKKTSDPLDYIATTGMPLMEARQISSLSGFVKCADASLAISGPDMDREAVNTFLNSGFYYE